MYSRGVHTGPHFDPLTKFESGCGLDMDCKSALSLIGACHIGKHFGLIIEELNCNLQRFGETGTLLPHSVSSTLGRFVSIDWSHLYSLF